jgi:hypothetical protein
MELLESGDIFCKHASVFNNEIKRFKKSHASQIVKKYLNHKAGALDGFLG